MVSGKGRINAIEAIVGMEFLTVALFENIINSDVFYASQALIPVLPEKAVLVMDNVSFQADMVTAIEELGTLLEFLPPYSPQFHASVWNENNSKANLLNS